MTITIIKEGTHLRILEAEGTLPENTPIRLFTEDELEAVRSWRGLSSETKEMLLGQTQSAAYREWMDEDDWEEAVVDEARTDSLSLDHFEA